MDLQTIRDEIRRLSVLVDGWSAAGEIPDVERDLALEKLRRLYETLRFADPAPAPSDEPIAADSRDGDLSESIDLGEVLSLDGFPDFGDPDEGPESPDEMPEMPASDSTAEPIAAPAQAPPVPPIAPAPLQAVRTPNSFPEILPRQSFTASGIVLTTNVAEAVIALVDAVRERIFLAAAPAAARFPIPSAVFSTTLRPIFERIAVSMALLALFWRIVVVAWPAPVLRNCCVATPVTIVLQAVFPACAPESFNACPIVAPWRRDET